MSKEIKVLVIGDAILDKFCYGSVTRSSPEDPSVSVLDVEYEEYRLGGCLNVASNIFSLSRSVAGFPPISVCLSSIFSPFTGLLLEKHGIRADESCILHENSEGTNQPSQRELIKTRFVMESNNRHLLRVDNKKHYDDTDVQYFKNVLGHFKNYDALIVSDYSKGLINQWTIEKIKSFHGPVFVDTKKKDLSIWSSLPNAVVKINSREYKKAENKNSLKNLIVTKGNKGSVLYHGNDTPCNIETVTVNNPDVVGCGDVFLAGLVVSYLCSGQRDIEKKYLLEATKFANICASENARQKGTCQIWL